LGEEADVVAARVEGGLEGPAAEAELQALCGTVVWGRDEEKALGAEDSMGFGEKAEDVLDVLEDLACPRGVEARVDERQLVAALDELDAWMAFFCMRERHHRHVAPHCLDAVIDERGGEVA
jgi:hypothetical protein